LGSREIGDLWGGISQGFEPATFCGFDRLPTEPDRISVGSVKFEDYRYGGRYLLSEKIDKRYRFAFKK
jgi:hypothetical protein